MHFSVISYTIIIQYNRNIDEYDCVWLKESPMEIVDSSEKVASCFTYQWNSKNFNAPVVLS